MGGIRRGDWLGRFAARQKIMEAKHGELCCVLPGCGPGSGGGAFGEAAGEEMLGGRPGEEEMLGDLLDAPLIGGSGRAKLGLRGVEPADSLGELLPKPLKGGMHRRDTVHRRRVSELWILPDEF